MLTKKPSLSKMSIPTGGTQGGQETQGGSRGDGQDDQHHGGAGQADQGQ